MNVYRILFVFELLFNLSSLCAANVPQGYVIGWGDNALYGCNSVSSQPYSAGVGVATISDQALTNAVAITAGSPSLALLSDGTVFGWGDNYLGDAIGYYSGTEITNGLVKSNGNVLSNVVAITWGSLALKSNGRVIGWRFDRDTNFGYSRIVVGKKTGDFI